MMDFLFDSAEAQEGLGSENQSGAIGLSKIDMTGFFFLEEMHNSNDLLETQSTITHLDADKDVCVAKNEKRKKRGPLRKETKAKKKKKVRIKRAEKDRKLGVNRLKLQPVVKAIKVTHCRHYMKGRCQEGEKCKFSHDIKPLTKSTPCCHFARRSCMKGDDCPYDHQLSKYSCNNFVTNGFCHRGADCMFSHEISVTVGSLTSSNICKADLKSPVQNSDLNPKKQHGRKFDSSSKSLEKSEKILVPDPGPKGISMISFGGSSSSSKHDKSPMPVEENVVNLDQQATINSLNRVDKSNEVANKVPLRPKGINFLSFGKTPLNASQFDGHHDVGESLFGGLNRSSIFDLPSSGNNKTPDENMISDACKTQGWKFLSFGKKSEDNISAVVGVEQSGSCPNNVKNALPCNQRRENSFCGPKSSIDMPQGSSCSSNPFSLCSDNSSGTSFSIKESFSSNVPKSALKALNSTLAIAAKFDLKIKLGPCISNVDDRTRWQ